MGTSTATFDYAKPAEQAFDDALAAFARIGRITASSPQIRTIAGRVRIGLQLVDVAVSVHPRAGAFCTIEITGTGGDLLGWAAGRASDRLARALD